MEMLMEYQKFVRSMLNKVYDTQFDQLVDIGEVILDKVASGGRFVIFGAGHGHILAEEMYEKPGGFMFPEIYNPMDLFGHPLKAGYVERNYEFGEVFYKSMNLNENDVFWLISNSGTNGVVVELAKRCREDCVTLVTHTNMNHTKIVSPRHPSGKKMYEFASYIVDNCGEHGDAIFPTVGDKKQGATSNMVGTFIFQGLNVVFASILSQSDCDEQSLKNNRFASKKNFSREVVLEELKKYKEYYFRNFDEVVETQLKNIQTAAELSSEAVMKQGRNFMFGMVHEHSLVEEIHSRAGTIMCNKSVVMQNTDIQLYDGVKKAQLYASIEKYADALLYSIDPKQEDAFFCVTQTSNEPAMRRFVQLVKEKDCKVIVHTNKKYADSISVNPVYLEADVVLDNCGSKDNAGLTIGNFKVGAIGTSIGCFMNQCYVMSMTKYLYEHGIDMPTRISINTDKGLIYTEDLNRKFFNDTLI